MTARELIAKLSALDPETRVFKYDGHSFETSRHELSYVDVIRRGIYDRDWWPTGKSETVAVIL